MLCEDDYIIYYNRKPLLKLYAKPKGSSYYADGYLLMFPAYMGLYLFEMFRDGGDYSDWVHKYVFEKEKNLLHVSDRRTGEEVRTFDINIKNLLPKLEQLCDKDKILSGFDCWKETV